MPARRLILVIASLLSTSAFALGPMQSERPPITPAQSTRVIDPACYCWANGQKFNAGERACLRTGMGTRLATCDMVTNVMSWSFSADPCPES